MDDRYMALSQGFCRLVGKQALYLQNISSKRPFSLPTNVLCCFFFFLTRASRLAVGVTDTLPYHWLHVDQHMEK